MILQALNDYYRRKMLDPDPASRLPPFGFEQKEIPFILEISTEGELVTIKDTRSIEGKKKICESFLVPKGVKKTSGVSANLLWDTAEYVLGLDLKSDAARTAQQQAAFKARIASLLHSSPNEAGLVALMKFLASDTATSVQRHGAGREVVETNPVLTFRLLGDTELICQRPAVVETLVSQSVESDEDDVEGLCLVTGETASTERLHSAIKGVWGAQTSGANIVSFNLDAFSSFGKEQGNNAPVGKSAAFAYTTALNHLLRRGSRQRIQVGDASTVFWAQSDNEMEDIFASVFGNSDNPDDAEELRASLEAIHSGKFDGARGDRRFYVLGLAPNAARISIRFWRDGPIKELAERIRQWFEDIAIEGASYDPTYPSLFRLLTACALQNKSDNIPPNLGGDIMRAILTGSKFPATWLNAAVQRSRAEQNVTYFRACAIKACLNRGHIDQKEFLPMLDPDNLNTAYRLGRLFATLEKLQEDANPGLNATIRDRYYGAASSTPVSVFTTLLRLKNHHVAKLPNKGTATFFEKLIGEIMGGISDFPAHLPLLDQGRFALGYYHQRQSFFSSKAQ